MHRNYIFNLPLGEQINSWKEQDGVACGDGCQRNLNLLWDIRKELMKKKISAKIETIKLDMLITGMIFLL